LIDDLADKVIKLLCVADCDAPLIRTCWYFKLQLLFFGFFQYTKFTIVTLNIEGSIAQFGGKTGVNSISLRALPLRSRYVATDALS